MKSMEQSVIEYETVTGRAHDNLLLFEFMYFSSVYNDDRISKLVDRPYFIF